MAEQRGVSGQILGPRTFGPRKETDGWIPKMRTGAKGGTDDEVETSDAVECEPTEAMKKDPLQPETRWQLVVFPQIMGRLRTTDDWLRVFRYKKGENEKKRAC